MPLFRLSILGMSIFGIIVFFIGWIYAISEFGFFIGVGIGWIPALFIAYILDFIFIVSAYVLFKISVERKGLAALIRDDVVLGEDQSLAAAGV